MAIPRGFDPSAFDVSAFNVGDAFLILVPDATPRAVSVTKRSSVGAFVPDAFADAAFDTGGGVLLVLLVPTASLPQLVLKEA